MDVLYIRWMSFVSGWFTGYSSATLPSVSDVKEKEEMKPIRYSLLTDEFCNLEDQFSESQTFSPGIQLCAGYPVGYQKDFDVRNRYLIFNTRYSITHVP